MIQPTTEKWMARSFSFLFKIKSFKCLSSIIVLVPVPVYVNHVMCHLQLLSTKNVKVKCSHNMWYATHFVQKWSPGAQDRAHSVLYTEEIAMIK